MTEAQQQIAWSLGALVALCTIIPAGVKVWRVVRASFLRWVKENLIAPVEEIRSQVADETSDDHGDTTLRDDVRMTNRFLEAHVEWSQEWTSRIERQQDEHTDQLADHARALAEHARRLDALESVWPPKSA